MSAQRAREAKELITDLGPAFVKIVQAEAQLKSKCTNLCNILLYCTHRRSHKNQGTHGIHAIHLTWKMRRYAQCAYSWRNLYLSFDLQVFASRPDALPEAYQKEGSIEMIS